jgi:hypothetical protein
MQINNLYKLLILIIIISQSTVSFAVQLSPSYRGGAIFIPLYSAENENGSALTISNSGDHPSAVKVIFLDQSGVAISGINLYLPKKDTWVMFIASNGHDTEVSIADSTCTAPYLFQSDDPSATLSLPTVGQILVIEMGVVTGESQSLFTIDHESLLPQNCELINNNWESGEIWSDEPDTDILPPEEKIRAELQIINVQEGTLVNVPGLVLTDFSDVSLHTSPADLMPDLSSASSDDSIFENGAKSYVVSTDGQIIVDDWSESIDAVSVLLATRNLTSAYTAQHSIGATAEWVLAFPTLKHYETAEANKDFSNAKISYQSTDRNTKRSNDCQPPITGGPPCPPDGEFILGGPIVAIGTSGESQLGVAEFYGDEDHSDDLVSAGQLEIGLNYNHELRFISDSGIEYFGLPVFAFGVQKYINGYLSGPNGQTVLANYRSHIEIDLDKFQLNSSDPPPATEDWGRDIVSTALDINVLAQTATATIVVRASASLSASFEIGDLEITDVRGEQGPLIYKANAGQLDVGLPSSGLDPRIEVDYRYVLHDDFKGVMSNGMTMSWPYYCGNMFPCKSNPADGLTFELSLSNVNAGQVAVFPKTILVDAPSYQIGWAIGDYEYVKLGVTDAGTQVGVWYLAGNQATAEAGTASLVAHFNWLEKTYGPYPFGNEVASVEAAWGPAASGGMEHHPFWHIGSASMSSAIIHAHEAAHGWFGDGVRIACWEDFVLSEGTASYLSARAVEAVDGQAAGDEVWVQYTGALHAAQQSATHKIAWPNGCGTINILEYFSNNPNMKGAHFLRAVELRIGRINLDMAIAQAFARFVGRAASMQDMLDVIREVSGYDASNCANDWLRIDVLPADVNAPCP